MTKPLSKKKLITVAPNGAYKSKSDHPRLPITPAEIADEVEACVVSGAGMAHLHARDADGKHSLAISDNAAVLDSVKSRIGDKAVLQLTTEAIGIFTPDEQMALIKTLKPEAASFAIKELIPDPSYEKAAESFFHWTAENKILAQHILYSADDLRRYVDLKRRGVLPGNWHHLLFVLGRYHKAQQSMPSDLKPFLDHLNAIGSVPWGACAFGQKERDCLVHAARFGGDARVGFENNLLDVSGGVAASSASQVIGLATALNKEGYEPMTATEVREHYCR